MMEYRDGAAHISQEGRPPRAGSDGGPGELAVKAGLSADGEVVKQKRGT